MYVCMYVCMYIYIYIYIHICVYVYVSTPPDKKTGCWKFSFESPASGAGLQFLLLGRMAKA